MHKLTTHLTQKLPVSQLSAFLVLTIPFGIKSHNIAVILFLTICIVGIDWKEMLKLKWYSQPIPILYFLQVIIIAFGLLHSANLEAGFNDLERAIYPLVVLPIIYLMCTAKITVHYLLKYFAIGCTGLTIYGFIHAWLFLDKETFEQTLYLGHKNFTSHILIQPLYLSTYFLLILFFFLEILRAKWSNLSLQSRVMIICLIGVVIAMVFFLRSKTALLLLPTLLIIYLVIVLKKRGWWVAFILLLVTLVSFLLDKNGPPDIIDSYGRTVSKAFDQRLMIWRGAIEGIKVAPFFGAGTGDTQALLNEGYAKIGYEEGVVNEFNAHNQYLQFMARNGLLELVVFLSILGYSFWRSAKKSNYTFLMFNMLVAFVMITESFLSVQKGIVFFYFFLLAFTFLGDKKSEKAPVL